MYIASESGSKGWPIKSINTQALVACFATAAAAAAIAGIQFETLAKQCVHRNESEREKETEYRVK